LIDRITAKITWEIIQGCFILVLFAANNSW
jgi:hypothetical protein